MNHLMDVRAKAFLRQKPLRPQSSIFKETWTVSTPKGKISGHLQEELRDYCATTDLLQWWQKKDRYQAREYEQIDWMALQKAMTSLKLT